MNIPLIYQLVLKDLRLWRRLILIFAAAAIGCVGLLALLYDRIPQSVFMNLGLTLVLTPLGTLGIVLLIQTCVFEKAKSTQKFIMSLPVTATDFAVSKLLVNIPIFAVGWLALVAVACSFVYQKGVLPVGSVPYVTMIFFGVFVAYLGILCVSLLCQTLGLTIISIMVFEVLTSAYLWLLTLVPSIGGYLYGKTVVWNAASWMVILVQVAVGVAFVAGTLMIKCRQRDLT